MARKIKDVTIEAEGRDQGKTFRITEMSAANAEKWAARAIMAVLASGAPVSEEVRGAGVAALTDTDVQRSLTSVSFDALEPLLDEMMTCVQRKTVVDKVEFITPLTDDDVDEVVTLIQLRAEVIELHVGFSVTAALSRLGAAAKDRLASSLTPTSPPQSEPS